MCLFWMLMLSLTWCQVYIQACCFLMHILETFGDWNFIWTTSFLLMQIYVGVCAVQKAFSALCVCVCALFKFRWASVKWFRGKFKFFNITGGFNTKHSCSHEALSLRPSHSISTIKLFYRSKNNVSFHTSAFLAKAFWRAIHIHL